MTTRIATPDDADTVGGFVCDLLAELHPDGGERALRADRIATADNLLTDRSISAYVAETAGTPVGVITLNACAAVYAGGMFGEICELYVVPRHRSDGVGHLLIKAAIDHARKQGWQTLEVGAPDVPAWARTVAFYNREGFSEIGPRLHLTVD